MEPINYLIMSDIHEKYDKFNPIKIREKYKDDKIDGIFIAGDITNFGFKIPRSSHMVLDLILQERPITDWLQSLKDVFNCRIFFIPGNHDKNMREWKPRIEGVNNIYNKVIMNFNNTNIVGLSLSPCYDIPSLKDRWDNMVCNQATETKYYNRFTNLSMFPHDTNILLSHCPPFGYLDECVNEGNPVNIGSKGLLNLINIVKPKVVICGHVHEYPGKLEVILHADNQTTTVINVATTYKLLTIDNDKISIK